MQDSGETSMCKRMVGAQETLLGTSLIGVLIRCDVYGVGELVGMRLNIT
jgi:hypothetical protein